jgi:hypothetical protein
MAREPRFEKRGTYFELYHFHSGKSQDLAK